MQLKKKSHHQHYMKNYKNSLTLYILVVEVTCFTSWPSLSSPTVWSGGCFTFFRSLFDLHCISVKRPRTHKAIVFLYVWVTEEVHKQAHECPLHQQPHLPVLIISWTHHYLWMWVYWDKLGTLYEHSTLQRVYLQSKTVGSADPEPTHWAYQGSNLFLQAKSPLVMGVYWIVPLVQFYTKEKPFLCSKTWSEVQSIGTTGRHKIMPFCSDTKQWLRCSCSYTKGH